MKHVAVLFILILLVNFTLFCQANEIKENLVYSILYSTGVEYAPAFCREDSDTIYLLSGIPHYLTLRKTMVSYDPDKKSYKMETDLLDEAVQGNLELMDKSGQYTKLEPQKYTYYNQPTKYRPYRWIIVSGEEAQALYDQNSSEWLDYNVATFEYQFAANKKDQEINDLSNEINQKLAREQDITALVSKLEQLIAEKNQQVPPEAPEIQAAPIEEAFIINLEPGEYKVRFKSEDDLIMQGSEKKLVIFKAVNERQIGYRIIPGGQWSFVLNTNTPQSVVYADGTRDLFISPFFENQYGELEYNRMAANDQTGNPDCNKWVFVEQIPDAQILISYNMGDSEITKEQAFVVTPSSDGTGYDIVPHDPEGIHQGIDYTFIGFQISLKPEMNSVTLVLADPSGAVYEGSQREIRIIHRSPLMLLIGLLCFVPIILFLILNLIAKKEPQKS